MTDVKCTPTYTKYMGDTIRAIFIRDEGEDEGDSDARCRNVCLVLSLIFPANASACPFIKPFRDDLQTHSYPCIS